MNVQIPKKEKPTKVSMQISKMLEKFDENEEKLYDHPSVDRRNTFLENMRSIKDR